MAIRFAQGTSLATTKKTAQVGKVAPPQSNTMKGMPGFLRTKQDPSSSGLTGHVGSGKSAKSKDIKSFGPHREGDVPSRKATGYDTRKNWQSTPGKGGSTDKSYRATSTAAPATISGNKGTPQPRKPIDQRASGAAKGTKAGFKNMTTTNARFSAGGVGAGHPGRMESLRGKARTSWER
jgi:hypothetical protein